MPTSRVALESPLGRLNGRDCIYLDKHHADAVAASLQLEGDINGSLAKPGAPVMWVPYVLRFIGVAAWTRDDLDGSDRHTWVSSFDEVFGSPWAQALGRQEIRHIAVQTYDDVFNVLCTDFELKLGEPFPG